MKTTSVATITEAMVGTVMGKGAAWIMMVDGGHHEMVDLDTETAVEETGALATVPAAEAAEGQGAAVEEEETDST